MYLGEVLGKKVVRSARDFLRKQTTTYRTRKSLPPQLSFLVKTNGTYTEPIDISPNCLHLRNRTCACVTPVLVFARKHGGAGRYK